MTEYFLRWINTLGYIYLKHLHLYLYAHLSVNVSLASFSELLSGCFLVYFHYFWIFVSLCFQCQQPNTCPMFSASFTQKISIPKPSWCFFLVSWVFRLQFLDKVHCISPWNSPPQHILTYMTLTLRVILFILKTFPLLYPTERHQCQILPQGPLSLT